MKSSAEKVKSSNERIKELLQLYDISQTEFCKKTGLTKSAVSNYLNGSRLPRQDQLVKIADAFDISAAWLMGYDVPMSMGDRTLIGTYLTEGKEINRLEIRAQADRINLYARLLEAAAPYDEDQLTMFIETLKAMQKRKEDKNGIN